MSRARRISAAIWFATTLWVEANFQGAEGSGPRHRCNAAKFTADSGTAFAARVDARCRRPYVWRLEERSDRGGRRKHATLSALLPCTSTRFQRFLKRLIEFINAWHSWLRIWDAEAIDGRAVAGTGPLGPSISRLGTGPKVVQGPAPVANWP